MSLHPNSTSHGLDSGLRGVDLSVLCPVQRFIPQSLVKIELFNTQSINNKSTLIEKHIRERGLYLMCLTETWHQPEVYSALNEACPPSYSYLEAARSTGHGAGLAVIFRQGLEVTPITLPVTSFCECLAFKCKPPFFSQDCSPYLPAIKTKLCLHTRNV